MEKYDCLDKSKEYIIYCASFYAEGLAVRLLCMGFNVVAFLDNSLEKQHKELVGITIYSYQECKKKYPDAIYIIANENWGTAYGIGLEIEKDGYRYNDTYYIYQELNMNQRFSNSMDSWELYLNNKWIILIGEKYLCELFQHNSGFLCHKIIMCEPTEIKEIHSKYPDAFWIILTRGRFDVDVSGLTYYSDLLRKNNIKNYTGYFSKFYEYWRGEKKIHLAKVSEMELYNIDKVLFLKMSSFSGSMFIDSVMAEHPNVLYLGYSIWSANVWSIVKRATQVESPYIVEYIVKLIIDYEKGEEQSIEIKWIDSYESILKKYFIKKTYTEKEIFLYLQLAYYEYINGQAAAPGNYIIYMDVHSGERICDMVLSWLKSQDFQVVILEMIRRPYMRLGSAIRLTIDWQRELPQTMITDILPMMSMETVSELEQQFPIIRIRFEDVKLYPADILKKLCLILEIPWDDEIIKKIADSSSGRYVTSDNIVKGFDTKPIYYSYDEYFDAFDKFRLDMIFREKNKAYGYSYVEEKKYPIELTDSITSLFEVPFQFEKYIKFHSTKEKIEFRKKLAALCVHLLDIQQHKSFYPASYNFGDYLIPESKS